MKFSIENDDNIIVFSIKEKSIGADIAPEIKAKVLIEAQPDIKGLIFDIGNVESLDSSGLGAFLLAHRTLREYSIPVIIVSASKFVQNLMTMTQIDQLFKFYGNVDLAKEYINEKINKKSLVN